MKISGNMSEYNKKISFFEILSNIPSNNTNWYIFEFDAIETGAANLSIKLEIYDSTFW